MTSIECHFHYACLVLPRCEDISSSIDVLGDTPLLLLFWNRTWLPRVHEGERVDCSKQHRIAVELLKAYRSNMQLDA